jgi:hypothetical protein
MSLSIIQNWYESRPREGARVRECRLNTVKKGGWWLRADMDQNELAKVSAVLSGEWPFVEVRDEYPKAWITLEILDNALIGSCDPSRRFQLLEQVGFVLRSAAAPKRLLE